MAMRTLARPASGASRLTAPDPTKTGVTQATLEALTRLNDKSTQRMAADELEGLVQRLDADSVSTFISSICSARTWDPKPFARKECTRAVGLLVSETCPAHELVLQQHLGKLLTYLRKQMQDVDATVRDAACGALVSIAEALSAQTGGRLPGTLATPVVKVIFDCLGEQKKEAQSAAGQALLQVSPYLAGLDPELVKLLLRLLRSPTFLGAPALLSALACTDAESQHPVGLCKECASSFLPVLPRLIGQPGPSPSGILGCLENKDWAVRRAAGEALRALGLLLGPYFEREGCWDASDPSCVTGWCLQALEKARFDKVKEARDAAREASAVLQELVAYMSQGSDPNSWGDYSSVRCASPGGTISPGGSRPVSRTLERHTSVTERFQRAAAAADLVADPAASVTASKDSAAAAAEQRRLSSGSVTSAVEQVQEAGPTSQPAAPPPPAAAAAKRRSSGGASVGGEASSEQQLIKAHYAAAAEAGIDAQPSLDQCDGIQHVSQGVELASVPASRRTSGVSTGGAQQQQKQQQAGPSDALVVSPQQWQQLQGELAALRKQQEEQAATMAALSEQFTTTVNTLQARLQDMQQQLLVQQQQLQLQAQQPRPAPDSPAPSGAHPSSRLTRAGAPSAIATPGGGGSVTGSAPGSPAAGSGGGGLGCGLSQSEDWAAMGGQRRSSLMELRGQQQGVSSSMGSLFREQTPPGSGMAGTPTSGSGSPCVDLQAAYAAALAGSRGNMHLLRLIQRTGPVWEQLQQETALQLLRVFIQNVQDGVMLHRVLPWLWRLADEDAGHRMQVPAPEQQQLLAALVACPAAEDVQVQEKVSLLMRTLQAVWT